MIDNGRSTAASAMPQSEHERSKMRWDQSWGPTNRPFRHDKTSVLQLSWEDPHDDLKVRPEVSKLGDIFQDVYGFKVQHRELGVDRPGHQIMKYLSDFVFEEDDERALLIIYYAGHGHSNGVGPGNICIEGAFKADDPLAKSTGIEWLRAEPAIRYTKADVLLIFDCCDAGRLARPYVRGEPKSYFQFLGACSQDETTRGPGEQSFTSALVWALEQLAEKAAPFSTAELRAKIMNYEPFPKDQMPVLSGRREPLENITISVKGSKQEGMELAPTTSEREAQMERCEHIDLRFHFNDKVHNHHIEHTAEGLKDLLQHGRSRWTRVSFLGKSSILERESSLVQRVANRWREATLEKKYDPGAAMPASGEGYPAPVITMLQHSESPGPTTATADNAFKFPDSQALLTGSAGPFDQGQSTGPRNGEDATSSFSGHTEVGRKPFRDNSEHDSIAFHLRAIARNLQSQLSAFFSRIARWLMPRSDYERIPDEPV